MFTGLIEGMARVERVDRHAAAMDLTLELPAEIAADLEPGASLAVNGACLTVERVDGARRRFRAIEETLEKTNLGRLRAGRSVNVERALRVGDRLGGHWVQGHVDGVGILVRRRETPGQTELRVDVPPPMVASLVPKGSVCLEGVSLTVVEVGASWFTVALIPETLERTTLGTLKPGGVVNIETDILAKYVAKLFGPLRAARPDGAPAAE